MNIEELIRDNRHEFEASELPVGYLSNFEAKLCKPVRRLRFSIAISAIAAAVVALIFILEPPTMTQTMAAPCNEVAEMQAFYAAQQQRTITIIEKLLEKVDPVTRVEIRAELLAMRSEDAEFRSQKRNNLPIENYIAYEVEYYKTRQQNLEYIQEILEK